MKKKFIISIVSCLLLTVSSSYAYANKYNDGSGFKNSLGIGPYVVEHDFGGSEGDDSFVGKVIKYTRSLNENIALKAAVYSVENDSDTGTISGSEGMALLGSNFSHEGINFYTGVGYYSENIDIEAVDVDYGGFEVVGGIAFNWPRAVLEYQVNFREATELEDELESKYGTSVDDISALSYSMNISLRF
jgi:hypothetical protein